MSRMRDEATGVPATLRAFERSDIDACLVVFDANVPESFAVEERDEFRDFLENLPGPYLVMEDPSGCVIGCGGHAFEDDGVTASLCWGMVHPERQGEGLGLRLLRARVDAAIADPNTSAVRLATTVPVSGFFERSGFRVVERIEDGFAPGLDSVEMRWDRD